MQNITNETHLVRVIYLTIEFITTINSIIMRNFKTLKRSIAVLAFGLFLSFNINAQSLFKVENISVSFSTEQEILKGLDADAIMRQVDGDTKYDYANMPFGEADIYSMACENPNVRIGATLPLKAKGFSLYLGANVISDRWDMAYYRTGEWMDSDYSTLQFESHTDEIGLEAALIKKVEIPFINVNVYGGLGTNIGYSFNGEATISGQNIVTNPRGEIGKGGLDPVDAEYVTFSDTYRLKNGFHQRAYLQGGIGKRFLNVFEIGLEGKFGYGYRLTGGTAPQYTKLTSLGANLKYNF